MSLVKAIAVGVILAATVLAADPFVGTWKLDVGKSKLREPSNFTGGLTITIEAAGENTLHFAYDRVAAATQEKGQNTTSGTLTFDGKPQPMPTEQGATRTPERIDEHHFRVTFAKDGKPLQTQEGSVSTDGRILTMTI